jgi:predicted acetyltransferase
MREPRLLGRAADDEIVSVRLAGNSERRSIEHLLQFYIYDFSEMEPHGSSDMEFGEQGNYSPLPDIDSYWRVEGFRPLLIRVKERLAGFALIDTRSHRGGRVEHNMAEFFVAPKHRRHGVDRNSLRFRKIRKSLPYVLDHESTKRAAQRRRHLTRSATCA